MNVNNETNSEAMSKFLGYLDGLAKRMFYKDIVATAVISAYMATSYKWLAVILIVVSVNLLYTFFHIFKTRLILDRFKLADYNVRYEGRQMLGAFLGVWGLMMVLIYLPKH